MIERRLYTLLAPPELAICLRDDPAFALPAWVPFAKLKMRIARQILR